MANGASLLYWQEKLSKTVPHKLELIFDITGAKANSPVVQGVPVLTAYDAIASQTTIDNFLGTTNEFLIAAFDATSMGVDTIAAIVDMKGQAAKVVGAELSFWNSTGATEVPAFSKAVTTLTTSTLVNESAVGASGNIALRATATGLDAATAGKLVLTVWWLSK